MRCFFITPLKSPDHPVPSGDRTIARLFRRVLEELGHPIASACNLQTFSRNPRSAEQLAALEEMAEREVERILKLEMSHSLPKPGFVFTYHVYYKAPDLVGPAIARRLRIPYVIAEASISPKRRDDAFAGGEALAEKAIASANLLLCPTARDRQALDRFRPAGQNIVDLKPFLALDDWNIGLVRRGEGAGTPRLLTVGMMREGNKSASFAMLAAALERLGDLPWHLDIVGDGPQREWVQAMFASQSARVSFHGAIQDRTTLGELYGRADLFVWPGVNEPFGMVFLEAQAHGAPCLAGRFGGIEDVVEHDQTGILVENCDAARYAEALRTLLSSPEHLARMGAAAHTFIQKERGLNTARARLAEALAEIGIHSVAGHASMER